MEFLRTSPPARSTSCWVSAIPSLGRRVFGTSFALAVLGTHARTILLIPYLLCGTVLHCTSAVLIHHAMSTPPCFAMLDILIVTEKW